MSWQCKLVDLNKQPKEIGDMWEGQALPLTNEPGHYWEFSTGRLSEEYVRDRMALRKPLLVMLPGHEVFCVDAAVSGEWRGWAVSGDAPNLSMSPSINCVGQYHGFLRNGVISDDCEGRKFSR